MSENDRVVATLLIWGVGCEYTIVKGVGCGNTMVKGMKYFE